MVRYGIDCAERAPSSASLRSHGLSFIARYLSGVGNSKNLTREEALAAHAGHIDIVTVWETWGNRALDGHAAGRADALAAVAYLKSLGAPVGVPVYFAVDYDPAGNAHLTDAYFDGVFSVLGKSRTGVYGGYEVVARQMQRGAHFGWQTYAWSGWPTTRWYPKAQLRQYSNGHYVAGVSVDLDQAVSPNFGQWFYVSPPTKRIVNPIIHPVIHKLGPWRDEPRENKIPRGYRAVGPINGWWWLVNTPGKDN